MSTADQIYDAVARCGAGEPRRSEELARLIEDDIASQRLEPGANLGSFRELTVRFCVGRSVLGEAIRILERRGLGRMRPGACGGFILARPLLESVSEEIADFFRLTGVTARQLIEAREAVDGMAARLAADRRPAASELDPLRQIPSTRGDWFTRELALRTELARLSQDPAVLLFVQCLNSLTVDSAGMLPGAVPDPLDRGRAEALAAALQRGDGQAAADAVSAALPVLASTTSCGAPSPTHGGLPGPARPSQPSRPAPAAHALAKQIAALGDAGARLGSEWELCDRFKVGRLVLRQAIRILEDGGLVECRRGRGNGLVVRAPHPAGAIRQGSAYLASEQLDPMSIWRLLCLMNIATPVQAAIRADAAQRRRLLALLDRVEASDPVDRSDNLELVRCVAEVADNPVIDVFCRCLVAFEARFRTHFPSQLPPRRQGSYYRLIRRFLDDQPWDAAEISTSRAETAELMLSLSRRPPP